MYLHFISRLSASPIFLLILLPNITTSFSFHTLNVFTPAIIFARTTTFKPATCIDFLNLICIQEYNITTTFT